MDIFFFQLIIIFIPGIIWERMDAQFGPSKVIQQWDILRRTFVFGLAAYVVTFCFYWAASWCIGGLNFQLFKFAKDVEFLDTGSIRLIFAASVVSILCATLWLYASTYKLPTWDVDPDPSGRPAPNNQDKTVPERRIVRSASGDTVSARPSASATPITE